MYGGRALKGELYNKVCMYVMVDETLTPRPQSMDYHGDYPYGLTIECTIIVDTLRYT